MRYHPTLPYNQQTPNYAQISQDIFVLNFFKKQPGFYVDLGCGDGRSYPNGNNTMLLEEHGWNGIGIDIDVAAINTFNSIRRGEGVHADLSQIKIEDVLRQLNAPAVIDYLSYDIDLATEVSFNNLSLKEYKFKFVTFEHNKYHGDIGGNWSGQKQLAQERFLAAGYEILIDDVCLECGPVEDWYILPEYFTTTEKHYLKSINHKDILATYNFV